VDVIEANASLFEAYKVKDVGKLYAQYTKNPLWTPFAETVATVLAVNTKLVPEAEIPSTWAELANPKWKGKIAFAGADKSSSALTQMLQIVHNEGEPKGWNLFSEMMKNFVITGNSTAVIRGTAQGEYAMSLTLEDNAQRFIDGGAPIRIVIRPEHFELAPADVGVPAEVQVVEPTGAETFVQVDIAGIPATAVFIERHAFTPGERIALVPKPGAVHVFDPASGARL
jgi:iron(III) transport system substrate-binding protein